MTDLERFKQILQTDPWSDASRAELKRIVDKNQNAFPAGAADGSFTSVQWFAAKGIVEGLSKVAHEWERMNRPPRVIDGSFIDDDLPF